MRGLVVSGGGAAGIYAVGCIERLAEVDILARRGKLPGGLTLLHEQLPWGVMSGTSTGALIAAGLAGGRWIHLLRTVDAYRGIRSPKDVYKAPLLGLVGAGLHLLRGRAAFDPAPLWERIQRVIVPREVVTSGVELRISVVNLRTGNLLEVRQGDKDLLAMVLASATIPGVFPPVHGAFVDGGVREVAPLRAAIDAGADEIDLVLCSPPFPAEHREPFKGFGLVARALGIHTNEVLRTDIETCLRKNADPAKRRITLRVYFPRKRDVGTLDFGSAAYRVGFEVGRRMAEQPLTAEEALAWRP